MNKLFIMLFSLMLFLGCCGEQNIIYKSNNIIRETSKENVVVKDAVKKENVVPSFSNILSSNSILIIKEKPDIVNNDILTEFDNKDFGIIPFVNHYKLNNDIIDKISRENNNLINRYNYVLPHDYWKLDIDNIFKSPLIAVNVHKNIIVEDNIDRSDGIVYFDIFAMIIVVLMLIGFTLLRKKIVKLLT